MIDETHFLRESLAELFADVADAEDNGTGEIPCAGLDAEAAQDKFVRVALPDAIEKAARQINLFARPNTPGDIHQHAVTQLKSVIQPQQRDECFVSLAAILEHAFARHRGVGVFAERRKWMLLR